MEIVVVKLYAFFGSEISGKNYTVKNQTGNTTCLKRGGTKQRPAPGRTNAWDSRPTLLSLALSVNKNKDSDA